MRRILIIAAMVVVLLGGGVWAYLYFFAGEPGLEVGSADGGLPLGGEAGDGSAGTGTFGGDAEGDTPIAQRITTRLTRISKGPVVPAAGVFAYIDPVATSSTADVEVRYMEQRSGNLFSYLVRSGELSRISNRTILRVAEAAWPSSGEQVFARYLSGNDLSTVETYALAADGSTGFFLPQGLMDIDVSSTSILMVASGATGSVASVARPDGTGATTAFTTPMAAIRAAFAGRSGYMVYTKPAVSIPGYLFFVSTSGAFSRLLGPTPGLVALPNHSGTKAIVSSGGVGDMQSFLISTDTGELIPLPVSTIADKCVWAANDLTIYCAVPESPPSDYSYPDDWYQGAVHFSDKVWRISVEGRYAQLILEPPSDSMGPVDAVGLALDPSDTVLVFVNKNDGSLWSYQL